MKIKFIQRHVIAGQTRAEDLVYENGQVVDFGKDAVANTYASAYINRGYAVEYDEAAERAAEKAARDEAKARTDAEAKAKAEADAKARLQQSGQSGQK